MMNAGKAIRLAKGGAAVGFTAAGETICAQWFAKVKVWRVWVGTDLLPAGNLTDGRRQSFVAEKQAAEYAASLIDAEATARLKWWN
jgi:hypothetical protein